MTTPPKLNGYYKWVALLLPFVLAAFAGFFVLKTDVRVVESNVNALEDKVEFHYQSIRHELAAIKEMIR